MGHSHYCYFFSSARMYKVHSPSNYGQSIKWRNSEERQLMKWVGIFQVGIFWVGIFRGGIFQGGVWWVGIFRVGIFPGGIFLAPLSIYVLLNCYEIIENLLDKLLQWFPFYQIFCLIFGSFSWKFTFPNNFFIEIRAAK